MRGCTNGIHVWWTKCKRKKKEKWKRKHMAKRKTKHKKSQFKITTTICKLITKKKKRLCNFKLVVESKTLGPKSKR